MILKRKADVLVGGRLLKVMVDPALNSAELSFSGGEKVAFSGKKADRVRRLRLKPGDFCLAQAKTPSLTSSKPEGLDVKEEGTVISGGYLIVSGEVERTDGDGFLLKTGKDHMSVVSEKKVPATGMSVSCLLRGGMGTCDQPCRNSSFKSCASCRMKNKSYTAVMFGEEKEGSYGN